MIDLDAIEALAKAASEGPWRLVGNSVLPWVASKDGRYLARSERQSDNKFIIAAREAVPALIAEVRALRELVEVASAFRFGRCEVQSYAHDGSWVVVNYGAGWAAHDDDGVPFTRETAIAYARKMAEGEK